MRLTERDKLEKDLQLLIFARKKLGEIRQAAGGKRATATLLRFRMTRMISLVDTWIGDKKDTIAEEEIRERLEGKHDESSMGTGAGETGETAAGRADDHPAAVAAGGRAETGGEQQYQRIDAQGGTGEQLGTVECMRGMAANQNAGDAATAGGENVVENYLRRKYRNNNLKDWQKVIVQADLEGKHERLVL